MALKSRYFFFSRPKAESKMLKCKISQLTSDLLMNKE